MNLRELNDLHREKADEVLKTMESLEDMQMYNAALKCWQERIMTEIATESSIQQFEAGVRK